MTEKLACPCIEDAERGENLRAVAGRIAKVLAFEGNMFSLCPTGMMHVIRLAAVDILGEPDAQELGRVLAGGSEPAVPTAADADRSVVN